MGWQWAAMIALAIWSAVVWIHELARGTQWDDWDDGLYD